MALWAKFSHFCSDISIMCLRIIRGGDWAFRLAPYFDAGAQDA